MKSGAIVSLTIAIQMERTLKSRVATFVWSSVRELCVEKDPQVYLDGMLRLDNSVCHKPGSGCKFAKQLPFLEWELLLSLRLSLIISV